MLPMRGAVRVWLAAARTWFLGTAVANRRRLQPLAGATAAMCCRAARPAVRADGCNNSNLRCVWHMQWARTRA
jgi:hypothetical protein